MPLHKTALGLAAFKARSPALSAHQRSVFILIDGVRTADDVLASIGGASHTIADIDYLVAQGFLTSDSVAPRAPEPANDRTTQQRYSEAKPLATQLTATLGLRGFMLNLSIESAAGYDDLLALLPKIEAAVGAAKCIELRRALKG